MNERELIELKEEIEEAKSKSSELKGEKSALMKRLKEEWNCNGIPKAKKLINDMEADIEKLSSEINTGLEELDTMFEARENDEKEFAKEFAYLIGKRKYPT